MLPPLGPTIAYPHCVGYTTTLHGLDQTLTRTKLCRIWNWLVVTKAPLLVVAWCHPVPHPLPLPFLTQGQAAEQLACPW